MPTETMPVSSSPTSTPAYIPWKTFLNTLDALTGHMPNRIDKTAFPGQSGAVQSQLLLTLRFFGLIGDDGKPSPVLHAIAIKDEGARKNELRRLVEQKYAPLFALNLVKTTPGEFAEKMTEVYGITGDTRLKATRFFLNALDYLGIDVSPLLLRDKTKPVGNGTTSRRRRAPKPRVLSSETEADDADDVENLPDGESRSVALKSGGTLTISASTKFMSLSAADRKFVFDLIDQLEAYESGDAK